MDFDIPSFTIIFYFHRVIFWKEHILCRNCAVKEMECTDDRKSALLAGARNTSGFFCGIILARCQRYAHARDEVGLKSVLEVLLVIDRQQPLFWQSCQEKRR